MQTNDLVSVIMPAYNPDKELLQKAIKSVFEQTYSYIELVIGDDGSDTAIENYTDGLISGLQNPNDVKIKIVRCNVNKGISHARNQAITQSNGKWLVWLDSDDTLQNDCIEMLMRESDKYNLIIGECNVYEGTTVSRRKPKSYFEEAKKYLKTEKDPFLLNIISLQPQLLLKSDFNEIGGFDENYRYAELADLFLRYVSKKGLGKVNFIEDAMYNYNRDRENTLSRDRNNVFKQRIKALSDYLILNNIYGKQIVYNQRNSQTGMQEYILEPAKVIRGEGCIISDKAVFKGTAKLGHYVIIEDSDNSEKQPIHIGNNVNIGSFAIIDSNSSIGNNVVVEDKCSIYKNVIIGDDCKILYGARIYSNSKLGNGCIIGGDIPERMILEDRVTFMGSVSHSYRDASKDWDTTDEDSPIIGEGSIVGLKSIIIGGIRIGKNCYVSAGEILRHDLPDNTVYHKGKIHQISIFKGLIKTRF
jgi:glycosyltransferase involved in cell wall biosynthesis